MRPKCFAWKLEFIAESYTNEFAKVVEENMAQLPAGTAIVAMNLVAELYGLVEWSTSMTAFKQQRESEDC